MEYFRKIYEDNKLSIKKSFAKDGWLKNNNIIISFGSEYGVKSKAKLYLSSVYKMACKLQENVENSMNNGETENTGDGLKYPELFMYHLYRIFSTIVSLEDLENINKQIELLKSEIEEFGFDERSTKNTKNNKNNENNPLGGLFDMANQFLGPNSSGLQDTMNSFLSGGKDGKGFDMSSLTNSVGQLFSDPKAKGFVNDMVNNVKNSNTAGDLLKNIVGKIGDPNLTENINQLLPNIPKNITQMPIQPMLESITNSQGPKTIESNTDTQTTNQTNNTTEHQNNNVNPEEQE